jgi:hypothetical protein
MSDIATIVADNPVAVLIDPKTYSEFYAYIKAETEAFTPDLSSDKGRKEISSLAYKVTRTKTAIDAAGKKLNEEARVQINKVDATRREIWAELETLAEKVRKPLTDWETAEKHRVDYIKAMLQHIENCGNGTIDGEVYPYAILFHELEEKITYDTATFGEFLEQAMTAKRFAVDKLNAAQDAQRKADADRAELERLRAAEAERQAEAAAREAAEAVKTRQAQEAAEKAKQDRLAIERAAQVEADKLAAAERAAEKARADAEAEAARKLAALEAEKQAVIDAHAKAERDRIAEEKRLADEQAARDADKAHRGQVMKASKEAIMALDVAEDQARKIVLAIVAGEIPNVTLRF